MTQKNPSFEEAFRQLEELTARLERGGLPLEEMLSLYEQGMVLAAQCLVMLEEAELRVRKLAPPPGLAEPPADQQDEPDEGEMLPL